MKYLALYLILLLGFSLSAVAIEIGEGQVMRLSTSKRRAILKITKLDFKDSKRLYLSTGLGEEPITLQILRIKGDYAIVKSVRGEIDKYTLYEVFLERPNLDKFKRRKTVEIEAEERENRYLDNKKRHYISVSAGLMSLGSLVDEGEELNSDFSLHFGFGIKYKFRSESDLGFLLEYMTHSGHMTNTDVTEDEEFSSTFKAYKIGLLMQFEIGLYMFGGITLHELITKISIADTDSESKSSGQGYFLGAGYEDNFKASNWFYQAELTYYLIDYKKTEATIGEETSSENEEDLKQKIIGLAVNFGYSF